MTRTSVRVGAWVMTAALVAAATAVVSRAQARVDRQQVPTLGPPPALSIPPVQKRTLSNGVPVWIIESHEVPLVQVNLLLLAGSADDPEGKFGTASLTSAMLDEGAGSRSSLQIADEVDFLGATLAASNSFDASAVRLNVPASRLEPALALMADVAMRPTFPDADLERVRQERLTSLLQVRDDPESIVPLAFGRAVFGATHRYGTAAVGTESSVARLTSADLRAFHQRWYQPAHARIIVVGDITAPEAMTRLERAFGTWAPDGPAARRVPVPTAPQLTARQIYLIDMPEAPQSQIRLGWVGVARATQDFFALEVLNTILGGSFTSRLNQNLREEHQYTYGAASRFDMRLSPGPFVAAAGVQTDKTTEALREFFTELTRMTEPVTAEELSRARNYLALGFPADFETARDLSVRMEELIIYGLPDDYFTRYVPNIQAVTADDVQQAARRYIQPDKFAVVVVGDRKAIEPGIRALGLGPVRVMTVEDALGLAGN